MHDVLTDLTTTAVVAALEANTDAFYSAFGRLPGATLRDEDGLRWFTTGTPNALFNGVIRTDLAPQRADRRICALLTDRRLRALPLYWHLGPSTRPSDLGTRLTACGLQDLGDGPGMALPLAALPAPAPLPAGLQIVRVADDAALLDWVRVFTGDHSAHTVTCHAVFASLGLGTAAPLRHFLGLLHGEPVATASIFAAAGVVSVQHVTTRPAVQRRGIGTALTYAALVDGQQHGYQVAVLESSTEGLNVYRRLGFQQYCTLGLFYRVGESG